MTPDERLKAYRKYMNRYIFAKRKPPLEFQVFENNEIRLIGINEDGETITIPSFCTGFGNPGINPYTPFRGKNYTKVVILNTQDRQFNLERAFEGLDQRKIKIIIKDAQKVLNIDRAFYMCDSLKSIEIESNKTLKPLRMNMTFLACQELKKVVGNIDTSRAVTIQKIFQQCYNIQSILRTLRPDFRSVEIADEAFYMAQFAEQITLADLNFQKLTSTINMFACTNFKDGVDFKGFKLNNVKHSQQMFAGVMGIETLIVQEDDLDISGMSNMQRMFEQQKISRVLIKNNMLNKATDLSCMFRQCQYLIQVTIWNQHIKHKVNMDSMFLNCRHLAEVKMGMLIADDVWQTEDMFKNDKMLEYVDIQEIRLQREAKCRQMFEYTSCLEKLKIIHLFDNVETLYQYDDMFQKAYSLVQVEIKRAMKPEVRDAINKILKQIPSNAIDFKDR